MKPKPPAPVRRFVLLALLLAAATVRAQDPGPTPVPERSLEKRVGKRTFPSVFQAWGTAQRYNHGPGDAPWLALQETFQNSVARHDLLIQLPELLGLQWDDPEYLGRSEGFTAKSVKKALARRQELLTLNPRMVVLGEIRYRELPNADLPPDSPWWKRRKNGSFKPGNLEEGSHQLDFASAAVQQHVVNQCVALMNTGAVDGIIFDWWILETAPRIEMLKKVRAAIGPKALIMLNTGYAQPVLSAPYVNGVFMEGFCGFWHDWKTAADNLVWAEANLLPPRLVAIEAWYDANREEYERMRAVTALSLVYSNGYVLFADSNPVPGTDHQHDWYPFYELPLGRAVGTAVQRPDGGVQREFEQGTVLYNPPGNHPVIVHFNDYHWRGSDNFGEWTYTVPPGTGEIFLTIPVPPAS